MEIFLQEIQIYSPPVAPLHELVSYDQIIDQAIVIQFQSFVTQHVGKQTDKIKKIEIIEIDIPGQIILQQTNQFLDISLGDIDRSFYLTHVEIRPRVTLPETSAILQILVDQIRHGIMTIEGFVRGLNNLTPKSAPKRDIRDLQQIAIIFLDMHSFRNPGINNASILG